MDWYDNTKKCSELNINNATLLRCTGVNYPSCGDCESCILGGQLSLTKEWFLRCSDQIQRQFVLGLVHRFNSIDLHYYVNSLLCCLEGKDFIYTRSRNCVGSQSDVQGRSASNHALDDYQVARTVSNCLDWFGARPYWTKCNFMLGIMQVCNPHLLQIIGSESRSLCLLIEQDDDVHESMTNNIDQGLEDDIREPGTMVSVTGYIPSGTSQLTTSTPKSEQRPRSALKQHGHHRTPLGLGVSFSEVDETFEPPQQPSSQLGLRISQPPSSSKLKHKFLNEMQYGRISKDQLSDNMNNNLLGSSNKVQQFPSVFTDNVDFGKQVEVNSDEELYEDDYISVDPSSVTEPTLSLTGLSIEWHKDFIRCLPVHLSKFILNYLDETSLVNCLCVSKHWRYLTEEVRKDSLVHQIMIEEVMIMQGATAKGLNPRYAKKVSVSIPDYTTEDETPSNLSPVSKVYRSRVDELVFRSMTHCYEGVPTKQIEIEERNLYCGAYNVFVLQDSEDRTRCTTYNGGQLVASGASDRKIRLLDAATGRAEKVIAGHAGSVKCLLISEKEGYVISGSYDTSIRCWDIKNGKCQRIFRGHRASVLALSLSQQHLASASRDKTVKVWNFKSGKCRRTFKHNHVVLCVEVNENIVVSGCEGCKVKMWDIESAQLIKTLQGHQSPITGVAFNSYHIVSSSQDCYALAWSTVGKYKKCLQAFRHPKQVLCIKLLYCRVLTGSADGKLRVWNLLNGDCLRIIRGNSKNDVITSVYTADQSIVINTLSNLLILNFEPVKFSYKLPPDRPEALGDLHNYVNCPPRRRPRSYVRAQKQARGAAVESLVTRSGSERPLLSSAYLDRSVSMTPFSALASSSSRSICSAPPHHRVTRNITQSVDHHVQRLSKSREQKPHPSSRDRKSRPHSSPAKIRNRTPPVELPDEPVLMKDLITTCPKPGPLPEKPHVITRGRSAPAIRTKVLPGNERGWTTSFKGVVTPPSNKLMPTAEQTKVMMKTRPKSAHVTLATKKHDVSVPKSVSCLNLKTFSDQLQVEQQLRNRHAVGKLVSRTKQRRPNSSKI